jgi:hypothetical protein
MHEDDEGEKRNMLPLKPKTALVIVGLTLGANFVGAARTQTVSLIVK